MNKKQTALDILNENIYKFGLNQEKLNRISQEIKDTEKFLRDHKAPDYISQNAFYLVTNISSGNFFSWTNGRIYFTNNESKPFIEYKAEVRIKYIDSFRTFIKELCENLYE